MMSVKRVELRVFDEGKEQLSYIFDSISEAAEMIDFLRDFFPSGRFVLQPPLH